MPKTYNDIYFDLRNRLKEFGVAEYSHEARVLLCSASGKTTEQLLRDMYLYTSDAIEAKASEMLGRRLTGEPLAYVCGMWEFNGVPIEVTPDVLIPRSDTEVLLSAALAALRHRGRRGRVLDLCCGSGCIACAIASEMPAARIVAADISPKALELCQKNVAANNHLSRIIVKYADARTWPPFGLGSFDIIVCNPPYIASGEISELDSSVRDYEPHLALDGGSDGLDFYRSITKCWTVLLRPNGFMMFEVGEGQSDAVRKMLLDAGCVDTAVLKDTLGVERVVIGKWKNEQ